jgi:hypothetical protein
MPTLIDVKSTGNKNFDQALVKEGPVEVAELYNSSAVLRLHFTDDGDEKLVYLPRDTIHFWREA